MVNYLFLGVIALALSTAVYARWYGRRVRYPKREDGKVGISFTSNALLRLFGPNPDFSPALGVVLDQANRCLLGEAPHTGSRKELKYLISISEEALKGQGTAEIFKEIGNLYSQLGLGGARNR